MLIALLSSSNLASRRPLFEQYDCVVQSRTVRRPAESDAAVLMLHPERHARDGETGAAIARPRRLDRRQRAPRGLRPLPRDDRGRARVRRESGLRRRGAARTDQLPELRQPREAAHRVAADRVGPRARRRLPRARRAGGGWQRVALQRGRRGADLPDAGRRHGRAPARRPRGRPPRLRRRRRRDRARRPVPARSARLRAGQARRRRRCRRPCPSSTSTPLRATIAAVRAAVRDGSLRSAHDVAEGGLAVALAECVLAGASVRT